MSERTVAIIQARMGSTRLPGKVLKDIAGRPMLWHVVTRTRLASLLDETVVATTVEEQDDQIVEFCKDKGFKYVRGSEDDVLDRYYRAATETDADTVVRITSDCPLISPTIVDRTIRIFNKTDSEYTNTKVEYPNGLDVEAMAFATLERAWNEATRSEDREHVTTYVRRFDDFKKATVENLLDTSQYSATDEDTVLRWSVDYPSDLEFVRTIYSHLHKHGSWTFDQQAVFELLERHPEIVQITDHASPEDFELA
jgi:spore coat polysaccharide biosynthesis protein SpsF